MRDAVARFFDGLRTTFVGGASLLWLAPLIPLIAILPEFVQHVAEIRMGMFESQEAFDAQAMSAQRWMFGYFKIAGLIVAILAAARFFGGAGKRWWDLRTIAWKQFLIAFAANSAFTLAGLAIQHAMGGEVPLALDVAFQLVSIPLAIFIIGPLFGDRTMTLKRAYTVGWVAAAMLALFFVVAWWPAQQLHEYNHTLAMGQSDAVVWALMAWDSLLVGLMACWMGAALAGGYWLGRPPSLQHYRHGKFPSETSQ